MDPSAAQPASKTKGYIVLAAAVLMQACLGGIYAWGVFCRPLQAAYGYSDAQTQLVFGTCIFTFTVSVVFTGRLQDRFGPRPLAVVSGILLAVGYLTSAAGGSRYELLWLGSGLLNGLAIGFGYVCPIATAVKWFPRNRGLVSGLAVAGYGAAAIILMLLAEALLSRGWHVLNIFALVAVFYGTAAVASGTLLFLPGPIEHHAAWGFRRRTLLGDRRFWWLVLAMFVASFPGLIFIGNLKKISTFFGNTPATAFWALVTMAVGNSSGRMVWGVVYDRLGGRRTVLLSLSMIVLSAGGVILARDHAPAYLAAAFWVGFCYGGSFGIYAPEAAKLYGPAVLGTVYPLILLAHGITAVVGPTLVGYTYDLSGSYVPGLLAGGCVTLLGLAVCAAWPHPADEPHLGTPPQVK